MVAESTQFTEATRAFAISDKEFELFRKFIYEQAGITLTPAKKPLVVGRLNKRLRFYNHQNFGQYYNYIHDQDAEELQIAIDLLTTNETYFFREEKHFEYLAQHLKAHPPGNSTLRVWSAASSSGQEAYTLAMVLAETLGANANWEIVGTDISTRVIEKARAGIYPMTETQKIPQEYLRKYCLKGVRKHDGFFLVDESLKRHVEFRHMNLLDKWERLGQFDVVFLRNVMIYFDTPTKKTLAERIAKHMQPQAHLYIGHSESLNGVTNVFRALRPSIYMKQA